MDGATEVQFVYRDNQGSILLDQSQIPLCVLCYNFKIYSRNMAKIEADLNAPKYPPAAMAALMLEQLPEDSHLLNPQAHCGAVDLEKQKNQRNHYECATHYTIGLALMFADRECRTQVAQKIHDQGLTGVVQVALMRDFNFNSHQWRVAAKYHGHSIDLYTLKLKEDGQKETEFFESDEPTIENIIKEFFSK